MKTGYIAERLSFSEAGDGDSGGQQPLRALSEARGHRVAERHSVAGRQTKRKRLLFESRKSIHDLVRDDLRALMGNSRMSSADRQRLQQHFDSIRDMEITMDGMGNDMVKRCAWGGVEVSKLEALKTFKFKTGRDDRGHRAAADEPRRPGVRLQLQPNCDAAVGRRHGWRPSTRSRPTNHSAVDVQPHLPSRAERLGSGNNPLAAQAHAEIDVLRMQTFAAGLDHFKARGLQDKSFVLWTNAIADCPSDSFRNVPHIIWGNGGGHLKQGAYVDAGNTTTTASSTR